MMRVQRGCFRRMVGRICGVWAGAVLVGCQTSQVPRTEVRPLGPMLVPSSRPADRPFLVHPSPRETPEVLSGQAGRGLAVPEASPDDLPVITLSVDGHLGEVATALNRMGILVTF